MEHRLKKHFILLIGLSLFLIVLHYVLGVEDFLFTVLLCSLMVILFLVVSRINGNSTQKESVAVKTVESFYFGQLFWMIMLIVKSLHLPIFYEDVILIPLLIGTLVFLIIRGINVYKMRVKIAKGDHNNNDRKN